MFSIIVRGRWVIALAMALLGSQSVAQSNLPDDARLTFAVSTQVARVNEPVYALIDFHNSGTVAHWQSPTYYLRSRTPGVWGVDTVPIAFPTYGYNFEGAQTGFFIIARAPSVPGTYVFSWQMYHEGIGFFGDIYSTTITIVP